MATAGKSQRESNHGLNALINGNKTKTTQKTWYTTGIAAQLVICSNDLGERSFKHDKDINTGHIKH